MLLGGIEVHHHLTSGMAQRIENGGSFFWDDALFRNPLDQKAEGEKGDIIRANVSFQVALLAFYYWYMFFGVIHQSLLICVLLKHRQVEFCFIHFNIHFINTYFYGFIYIHLR